MGREVIYYEEKLRFDIPINEFWWNSEELPWRGFCPFLVYDTMVSSYDLEEGSLWRNQDGRQRHCNEKWVILIEYLCRLEPEQQMIVSFLRLNQDRLLEWNPLNSTPFVGKWFFGILNSMTDFDCMLNFGGVFVFFFFKGSYHNKYSCLSLCTRNLNSEDLLFLERVGFIFLTKAWNY